MADVMFDIVNTELMGKHIYKLSNVDIGKLEHYAKRQNYGSIPVENFETKDEEKTLVDFYLNHIFASNSEALTDIIYQPYETFMKQIDHSPIESFSFDDYNKIAIETAICGMPKNKQLPVPHKNYSLTDGCFGDDAGFMVKTVQESFIGKYKN